MFGLFSVTAMLVCYALEDRSAWYVLGFAAACALGSVYGFLQGAWPFGIVEAIWSVIALRRWRDRSGAISFVRLDQQQTRLTCCATTSTMLSRTP